MLEEFQGESAMIQCIVYCLFSGNCTSVGDLKYVCVLTLSAVCKYVYVYSYAVCMYVCTYVCIHTLISNIMKLYMYTHCM